MKKFLIGICLIIAGCISATLPIAPTPSQPDPVVDAPRPTAWPAAWDSFVMDAAAKYGAAVVATPIKCPDGSAIPFLSFVRGIVKAESGFNPSEVYHEPPPLGVDSIGLLQLSYVDYKNYGVAPQGDLKNPKDNLELGVRIMNKLLLKADKSSVCGPWLQLGRYWSTARPAKCWPQAKQAGYVRTGLCQ